MEVYAIQTHIEMPAKSKPSAKANIKGKNYVFPTPDNSRPQKEIERNLSKYITTVQLSRIRHDVSMWRDAIREAELAFYPHRVKMQRMFIDTILNGHTLACVNRRKDLTTLRDYSFKNDKGVENDELKKLFNKRWFTRFIEYALEARFFGYTLVKLDDIIDDGFPKLSIIRRFNVSPDRLNVAAYVYSISGAQFMEEPYANWHVWVPTPTDIGVSECGYGLLYNVAYYEILAKNLLGFNSDAVELYGMPNRVGKTQKTTEGERAEFSSALQNMGSAGWIMLDAMDEVELLETKGNGQGFKIYPDLEKRLESKISKIILGHSDALDSTPGKLGAGQGGADESPTGQALRDKQTSDGTFVEDVINDTLIPKLIDLGFVIDTSYKFSFDNNQELVEKRMNEDKNNAVTAGIAQTMKNAGLKMDAKYFEERTGIPTTDVVEVEPIDETKDLEAVKKIGIAKESKKHNERVKNKLLEIYS